MTDGGYWRAVAEAGDSDAQVLAAAGTTPEQRGRRVRARWVEWAKRQPADVLAKHPRWLLPYGALSLPDQEVDDEIGTDSFCDGWHHAIRWARAHLPGGPPAPGHRTLNAILSDASRASRAGDAATVAGLRAEYDAAAAALFNLLAPGDTPPVIL
jgi:hypothetical protein